MFHVHDDLPGGHPVHASQEGEDGGLARAAGTQHHAQFALFHLKTDVVGGEHRFAAGVVFLGDILKGDITHGVSFPNGGLENNTKRWDQNRSFGHRVAFRHGLVKGLRADAGKVYRRFTIR